MGNRVRRLPPVLPPARDGSRRRQAPGALGAWIGPGAVLWTAAYGAVAGGVLAVGIALARGYLAAAVVNIGRMLGFWAIGRAEAGPRTDARGRTGAAAALRGPNRSGTGGCPLVPLIRMGRDCAGMQPGSDHESNDTHADCPVRRHRVGRGGELCRVPGRPDDPGPEGRGGAGPGRGGCALDYGRHLVTADMVKTGRLAGQQPGARGVRLGRRRVRTAGPIVTVAENEPFTESKLAPKEAGGGLPPTIPAGMRAHVGQGERGGRRRRLRRARERTWTCWSP